MRWNVERDAGLLGTEEVWTPCDHNTDEMIRYQDISTKTFSQRSIHIYLQFLNSKEFYFLRHNIILC